MNDGATVGVVAGTSGSPNRLAFSRLVPVEAPVETPAEAPADGSSPENTVTAKR